MSYPLVQIKRVARVVNGGTPTPAEENWNGSVLWATPVDLNKVDGGFISNTDRCLSDIGVETGSVKVPAGSVILSTRAPIGYAAVAQNEISFNQGCKALVPHQPDETDSRYLRYAIQSSVEQLQVLGKGSTFLELSTQDLGSFRVPWPSYSEQVKIADQLDRELAEIDGLIADQQRLESLLEERYLAELEYELIEKATEFIELRRLNPICSSGTSVSGSPWPAGEDELGVLKTGVVSNGSFDSTQNKLVDDTVEILRLSIPVKANTIIVNRANSPELVGSSAYIAKDYPNLYLSDKLWQLSFPSIDLESLNLVFKTRFYKNQVRQRASGASNSMQNISFSDFSTIKIPVLKNKELRTFKKNIKIDSTISPIRLYVEKTKATLLQELFSNE